MKTILSQNSQSTQRKGAKNKPNSLNYKGFFKIVFI